MELIERISPLSVLVVSVVCCGTQDPGEQSIEARTDTARAKAMDELVQNFLDSDYFPSLTVPGDGWGRAP